MTPTATVTTNELCAATGATPRQIQWWTEKGILQTAYPASQGRGGERRFTDSEVMLARIALRLRHSARARRRIIAAIRKRQIEPPTFVVSDRDGGHIRFAATERDLLTIVKNAPYAVLVVSIE